MVSVDGDFDLTGRRALVTGGSAGIGGAIARRLGVAGASVAAVSRSGQAPDGSPPTVVGLAADLSNPDAVDALVDRAVDALGGLDIVVNNAGRGDWRSVADLDRQFFDDLVAFNLWTPLRVCQLAHRHLVQGTDPAVVMIGSIDGTRPSAGGAVYGATKAGLATATVALAKEWAAEGICVTQVDPGLIDTPMASGVVDHVRTTERRINLAGRVGRADEIAGLVHYLVSPLGRFATGASFRVDGGALALGPFDDA